MKLFRFTLVLSLLYIASAEVLAEKAIKIGGSKNLSFLPLLAMEEGMFDSKNIKVEYANIEVGKIAMDTLLAGGVDMAVIIDSNIAFNSFTKSNLKVLGSILVTHSNGFAYKHGIELAQMSRLKIGYYPATGSHLYLLYFLRKQNLSIKDIEPVILQPQAMGQSLLLGKADIISIWEPWRHNMLRNMGSNFKEGELDVSTYPMTAYLAVRGEYLEANRESIKKVIIALREAKEFFDTDRDLALKRYASLNGLEDLPMEVLRRIVLPEVKRDESIMDIVKDDVEIIKQEVDNFNDKESRRIEDLFFLEDL